MALLAGSQSINVEVQFGSRFSESLWIWRKNDVDLLRHKDRIYGFFVARSIIINLFP